MRRAPVVALAADRPGRLPLLLTGAALAALVGLATTARAQSARPGSLAEQTRDLPRTQVANGAVAPTIVGTSAPAGAATLPRVSKTPAEITIEREAFEYAAEGRRDPYRSLMTTSELRPLLSDLKLTAVAYDPAGKASIAILRDVQSKAQYRVRPGQPLGRMRIAAIRPRAVVFTIEEFGYNRQESLVLSDTTTKERKQP
jgi:hypothetical protein